MTDLRKAAIELLKSAPDHIQGHWPELDEVCKALAQPEQEPVAWVRDLTSPQPHCVTSLKYRSVADTDAGVKYIPVYTAPPSKPEQALDYGIDRGAWSDVPDATKWVDELRGDEDSEQKPVAWDGDCVLGHCGSPDGCDRSGCCRAAPPSKQEPIKYLANGTRYKVTGLHDSGAIMGLPKELTGEWVALVDATDDKHLQHTTPPSKPWVSIDDDEVFQIANKCRWSDNYHNDFARAIEAALRKLNHG